MEFIAAHWLLWLLLTIGCAFGGVIIFALGGFLSVGKGSVMPALIGWFIGIVCTIAGSASFILLVISIIVNIIDHAKGK